MNDDYTCEQTGDSSMGFYTHKPCQTRFRFDAIDHEGLTLEDGKLVPFCPVCERPDYERLNGYRDGLWEALRMINAKKAEIRDDNRDCACVLEELVNELSDLMK